MRQKKERTRAGGPEVTFVKSDQDIRKAALTFFENAKKSGQSVPPGGDVRIFGMREGKSGNYYYYTENLNKSLIETKRLCTRRPGKNIVSENDVEEILWRTVDLEQTGPEAFNGFCQHLQNTIQNLSIPIIPNYQLQLESDTTEFHIGPVQAIRGTALADKINSENPNDIWRVEAGTASSADDTRHAMRISDLCWCVKVQATQSITMSEAVWRVSVAMSLIRVMFQNSEDLIDYPGYGAIEPSTGVDPKSRQSHIIMKESKIIFGFKIDPNCYTISKEVIDVLSASSFDDIAKKIFNHSGKSLAARVFQGLGWLARGRQSEDQAERFLYFFTALESILTRESGSPVTDTVSRNVATILNNCPEKRAEVAATLKSLYVARSKLVHSGARDVSFDDSKTLQELAENVYRRVLDCADLEMSFDDFQNHLNRAGYGLPWPLPAQDKDN